MKHESVAALAALLAGAMTASAAAAAGNPVIDLSGLMSPGLWQTTVYSQSDGKVLPSKNKPECITAAYLKDFFNSPLGDSHNVRVESYKQHGRELVLQMRVAQAYTMTQTFDFDSADHMHGSMTVYAAASQSGTGRSFEQTTRFESERIADACTQPGG